MLYKRSSELFVEANKVIPGGVNSPVRAFKGVGGTPIFVKEAKGAYLYDEDGNRLIDYINSWGPMILGHAYEPVVNAVIEKAKKGTSFGMPTALETEIAQLAVSMVPGIDKIRFVNSGTEACMSAIRLARGYTKRDKIIKFAGCYHGHSDSFLIQAGSGATTFGSPNSPGVTQGTAKDTLLAVYNDIQNIKALIDANPNEIAAIIIEPVAGNMGCIPPKKDFLESLRDVCTANGILLIFDEVVTAYGRVGEWFAAQHFNVQPDIIITAKGITSGYIPLGAVLTTDAVAAELEKDFGFPMGFTYNGHPTAAAVALKNLEIIEEEGLLEKAKKMGQYLHEGLRTLLDLPIVGEVRFVGMMHAVELVTDKESRTPLPMLQPMLPDVIRREEGVIVRDCAHNLVLSPPLIMTEEEADRMVAAMRKVLERTTPDGVIH